jgi:hypothetical protein
MIKSSNSCTTLQSESGVNTNGTLLLTIAWGKKVESRDERC